MSTIKQYNKYIIDFNSINKGMQLTFRFPNNYGLSVVCHSFSYGNNHDSFEIAITKFRSDDSDKWNICYDTNITSDVLGHQSKEDVINIIEQVIAL
jgi:hypothetical protein